MNKIDQALEAIRANPVRFAAWALLLGVLAVAMYAIGTWGGHELYLFTH